MSSPSESDQRGRKVYLPLKTLGCRERVYCSAECQKSDWKAHKPSCGQTDVIDLASFYPLLALIVEVFHQLTPMHGALHRKIVNSPNPECGPVILPDGSAAKLIVMGDYIAEKEMGSELWWPTATSPEVREKMMFRILREGTLLPLLTTVCVSLLSEIYTTTSGQGFASRRVRLQEGKYPIADFGIACGSTKTNSQDRLAYRDTCNRTIEKGQDPAQHYWIYFTDVRGKEVTLDLGMFTFNFSLMVETTHHNVPGMLPVSISPAFYCDKEIQHHTPSFYRERKRLSVLRDTDLHCALPYADGRFSLANMRFIYDFTKKLSGTKCSEMEEEIISSTLWMACRAISISLKDRLWVNYPDSQPFFLYEEPGKSITEEQCQKMWDYMRIFKQMKREGKAGNQTMHEAAKEFLSRFK